MIWKVQMVRSTDTGAAFLVGREQEEMDTKDSLKCLYLC